MAEVPTSSTHPPLPPTTEDDRLHWLRLLRSRKVGISTFWRLMAAHGSAKDALAALPGIARASGIGDYQICPEGVVRAEIKAAKAVGARLLLKGEAAYPPDLAELDDAPPVLWARGNIALAQRPMAALVGARNASSLGLRMARALARDLSAEGFVVVSGLARGIDTAAHEASLSGGTVAVVAGGVDQVYPPENAGLMDRIAAEGLILSEQPMGLVAQARHFPARNRIVSGLARAVVVVEAAEKSGSLITARCALDQGREVLAVPGHPLDPRAGGCNLLLRDGATLLRTAADLIDLIGAPAQMPVRPELMQESPPTAAPVSAARTLLRDIAALHRLILDRLAPSPIAEDQLRRDLAPHAEDLAPALLDLELDGQIVRQPGGLLARLN